MPKFSRRPDDRPGEILEAALKRFAAKGFAASRMEEIAADAQVTAGTIYRYFPSKEALVEAVVDRYLDLSWARGRDIAEAYGSRTAREIVLLLLQRWTDHLQRNQATALLLLVSREAPNFPAAAQKYASQLLGGGALAIERALRHGIAQGEFALFDIEATARALAGTVVEGVLLQATFGQYLPALAPGSDPVRLAIATAVRGIPRAGEEPTRIPAPLPVTESELVERPARAPGLRIVTLRPPEATS